MVNMKIYEVKERTELLMEQLLKVWEESVRATHQFLSEKEIEKIKEYVPQALAGVQSLVIAVNGSGEPAAFMGAIFSAAALALSRSVSESVTENV